MENIINVSEIADQAARVAAQHEEQIAAIEAEQQAEAAVLEAAINAARPALRALSSRLVRSSYETAGHNGCNPVSRTEYHDERGLVLVNEYECVKDATGNRGSLEGRRLVVLTDGRLAQLTREGSFSHWQGEADSWESELEVIDAREAVRRYHLSEILETLSTKLCEQIKGSSKAVTKSARERAEKLSAIAKLTR